MIKMRIEKTLWDEVREYHLANNVERLSFLFGRTVLNDAGDKTIIIPPQIPYLLSDNCFKRQNGTAVVLHRDVQRAIYASFKASDFDVLVNIHDHWFSQSGTNFSSTDDKDDIQQDKFIRAVLEDRNENTTNILNLSIVFDQNTVAARLTDTLQAKLFTPVDQIQLLSSQLKLITPNNADEGVSESVEYFSRQQDVVGTNLQTNLSRLHIGLVGAGGLGSIVSEGLIRLGIKSVTIIDDDVIEPTNLNRLQGIKHSDCGELKATTLAKHLKQMLPSTDIKAVTEKVNSQPALDALKRCDLIIGAVDNDLPRYVINQISCANMVPYMDIATRIFNQDQDKVDFKQRLFISIPSVTSCMECTQLELLNRTEINHALSDHYMEGLYRGRGYLSDQTEVPTASIYALNMGASSMLLMELLNLYSGYIPSAKIVTSQYQDFSLSRLDHSNFDEQPHPYCSHCGNSMIGIAGLATISGIDRHRNSTSKLLLEAKKLVNLDGDA